VRGAELEAALASRLGGEVTGLRRLSGGASRETWSFALDGRPLILRRDPVGASRTGGMLREADLFRAAAKAGVPVPELLDASDDASIVGSSFLVMAHVDGETIPRKILRDPEYAAARPLLARQCGEVLARLHSIPLEEVPGLEDQDQVAQYRAVLDGVGQPHPAFELAFRWLEDNRPASSRRAVVHGDFRNGNVIVGPEGLRAVLDWELAHAGDPMEDLGWLCVKAWRFGVALPVGGFGTYEELIEGYGGDVDREALRWWEILGTLKWGIMCIMQAVTHTSGAVRSVELAAIGRRVCENELDLLELLP
jgi:aminoglycoside phosphotransferase (APT) family kinase protein